jgi:hypothetical protein
MGLCLFAERVLRRIDHQPCYPVLQPSPQLLLQYIRHAAGLAARRALINSNASHKFPAFRLWHMPHRVLLPCCLRYPVGQLQDHREIHPMLWVLEERALLQYSLHRTILCDSRHNFRRYSTNKREHVQKQRL